MSELRSLGVVELAKEIRAELKRTFPKTKFSVRSESYSMGSSVRVSWTDGPTSKRVEEVLSGFEGRSFDGMTDSTHYHPITLPSGETVRAYSYVTASRKVSDRHLAQVIEAVAAKYGDHNRPTVEEFKRGGGWHSPILGGASWGGGRDCWADLIHRALADRTSLDR